MAGYLPLSEDGPGDMATLGEVFKSFCTFGAGDKAGAAQMDGAKFAKFFRDLKLLDTKFTSTDVDIIFSKVKAKTERKITFKQFQEALKMVAEKKYPGDAEGTAKLKATILEGKGPKATGVTKTVKSTTVSRLTDTSKYTGTHKERFDDTGKGKGIAGRKEQVDGSGYVTGYKEKDTYDATKGNAHE